MHQYDKGVEKHNRGIEYIQYVKDEIYLENFDDALKYFGEAKRYFSEAYSINYYLPDDLFKDIKNALKITEENINRCYILKGYIHQLIEIEKESKAFMEILNAILHLFYRLLYSRFSLIA